jgi:type II secretory pathway pseudopilin PulG
MRRFTPVELAVGVAILGSLLAVAVPAFSRDLHASRFVEPTDGLARLGAAAVAYAEVNGRFPDSAPLTPAVPPRGKREADPPGTWDGPTWKALGFRPSADGVPHSYAFSFESTSGGAAFVAQAHGDLDGDGIFSTFEIRGHAKRNDGDKPAVVPGTYVEAELE